MAMHVLSSIPLIGALLVGPGSDGLADSLAAAPAQTEVLQGLDTVILTQINAIFGSELLPVANGAPVEPGMYAIVSPQQFSIFDQKIADLQAGALPAGPASRECKSGCKELVWNGFRNAWLQLSEENQTYDIELPTRVMIGAEASVPAHTVLELAYAAAESRPGGLAPNLALLINGGNAGLRTRPFYLLPPGGLRVSPGDNVLGLRVKLGAGETFTIEAAHPRFAPEVSGTGWKALAAELTKIKKAWPNKGALIIDVGDDASVGDVVNVMIAAQKHFDDFVLTDGLPVRWG
ncbi:hypothetical protein ACNOYE_06775 [Nannocystaceae bacterium ST9]